MIKRIMFVVGLLLVVSCTTSTQIPNPPLNAEGVKFLVSKDGSEAKSLGEPFEIPTDNCGSSTVVKQTQEKSRSYTTELNITVSDKVAAEIGGSVEVANAKLSAEIGIQLGVRYGIENTSKSSIEISVPAGKRTITTLQWKEEWTKGTVSVVRPNGEYVDTLPFSALNDIVLMLVETKTMDCTTGKVETQQTTPQISTPEIPVIPPTLTPVSIGTISVLGNSSEGIKFTATQAGVYMFKYIGGAYSTYPSNKTPPAGTLTWLTAVRVFKNRPVEWNGIAISNSSDYRAVDYAYYASANEVENIANGSILTVSLLKGDYLVFVAVDELPYYSDNPGEVNFEVLYTPGQ